jgi:hypothetical protein
MVLIDYIHIITATLFALSAFYKLHRRQSEHFFTRSLVALWFALTVLNREMPVDFVRLMSNYVIMLIPMVELIQPGLQKYYRGKV